ncbi:hypothetical protein [Bacillus sp. FJAT-27225]|uniref:hypothetical protein n=1 Tax=Bacillus sp. FJAT-27225 TaxID=1743144 RepID=UPI0011128305|nr:hypothetical protein [Bacillus sp. FJAT-27225]
MWQGNVAAAPCCWQIPLGELYFAGKGEPSTFASVADEHVDEEVNHHEENDDDECKESIVYTVWELVFESWREDKESGTDQDLGG